MLMLLGTLAAIVSVVSGDQTAINSTVASTTTPPTLTTNVTNIFKATPFVASCNLSGVITPTPELYTVAFVQESGILATYTVKENQSMPLFIPTEWDNVTVTVGDRFTHPHFDIVVRYHSIAAPVGADILAEPLWCEVAGVKSRLWQSAIPTLEMAVHVSPELEPTAPHNNFTAQCRILDRSWDRSWLAAASNGSYTVQFYFSHGTSAGHRNLAQYRVAGDASPVVLLRGNRKEVHNSVVTKGAHFHYPIFEVAVRAVDYPVLQPRTRFWCQLNYTDSNLGNLTVNSNVFRV